MICDRYHHASSTVEEWLPHVQQACRCFLVFIPTLGEFVIPSLLGGSQTLMIGKVLWEEFFNNRDWPVASAVAIILLLILIIPIILFQRNEQKQREMEG